MELTCVILAAGRGRRAGGYKPLMPLGDGLVIDRVIAAASGIGGRIRVVGGSDFPRLEAHLRTRWPGVEARRNAEWERGMFSSVRTGLLDLAGAAFVHPADVPGPGPDVYEALAAALAGSRCEVARPTYEGRRGHPVLLSPAAVRAVGAAPAGSNLREILSTMRGLDVEVPDDLVLFDFDTLDELDLLRGRLADGNHRGG
jgi:CTP:molybdopterin cytidylyltransferase MocA